MSEWIPVKRRPKECGWYLVSIPGNRHWSRHTNIAWWEPGTGYGWGNPVNHADDENPMPRPTHWRLLPKPARRGEGMTALQREGKSNG